MATKVMKDNKESSTKEQLVALEKRVADLEAKQRDHDEACPYKRACK